MYRRRLRPRYPDEELKRIYSIPHDSENWTDHKIRVRQTISLGKEAQMPFAGARVADLSCGNGKIADELGNHFAAEIILGDFAEDRHYMFHGPIEKTLPNLPGRVNLFICSETIEHLDNPDEVLRRIRDKSDQLLLSTPIGETEGHGNPEHYWGWDVEAVERMLLDSGWNPDININLGFYNPEFIYNYQIWLCS